MYRVGVERAHKIASMQSIATRLLAKGLTNTLTLILYYYIARSSSDSKELSKRFFILSESLFWK